MLEKISEKKLIKAISNVIIGIVIVSIALIGFSSDINSVFSGQDVKAYYQGNQSKKQVSIMINVYGGNEYLPSILDTLDKYKVSATFFVGGIWVQKNVDDYEAIVNSGHEIGNHGYFHKDSNKLSVPALKGEITSCDKLIKSLSGKDMSLFAPPSGALNDTTVKVASELGYKTIMWSKDTIDWRDQDTEILFKRATQNLKNGDMVLMHPTRATAQVLERIIKYYLSNSYSIVNVSTNIQ